MPQNAGEVRFAAQSLYQNAPNYYRSYGPPMPRSLSQSASINVMYTDDFLAGFMEDGRMSVVRRFFCLFVTFDLVFTSLLWLICILINGADIYDALKFQILQYDVHKSLFDIVVVAICRFSLLILFYAILSVNHWFIIAFTTAGSCAFLIYKVFAFNWIDNKEPVLQVLLIIASFVLSWGETWFLDCRVIPQEKHARNYAAAASRPYSAHDDQRVPLVGQPFGDSSQPEAPTSTFYSPYETIHNSDDEDDDGQEEDWLRLGDECVLRNVKLLESGDWQIDRVTDQDDKIMHTTLPKFGKIWRVTAKVNFPAKLLLQHLFYKIEDIQTWNPTILDSKILQTLNDHCDITWQATASAGMVKSRDFVNLRCWQLCRDGQIVRDDDKTRTPSDTTTATIHRPAEPAERTPTIEPCSAPPTATAPMVANMAAHRAVDVRRGASDSEFVSAGRTSLGMSLGASGFFDTADEHNGADEELEFADAEDQTILSIDGSPSVSGGADCRLSANNVYVSSAVSIDYDKMPAVQKYIRGDNKLSCWAMREIVDQPNACIFEWLMCIDLKGYVPTAVLNKVYPSVIQDYMISLRKYCEDVKAEQRKHQRPTS